MKILFVLTYYSPYWTGLTQYATRLAEGLIGRGHDVSVLTARYEAHLEKQEVINDVRVERLPVLLRVSRTLIQPSFLPALIRQVQKNDCVIAYLPLAEVVLVALVTKLLGKKLYLVHNGDLTLPSGLLKTPLEWLYGIFTSIAIFLCDSIMIQTADYGEHSRLLSRFKNKWQVILPLYPDKDTKRASSDFKKRLNVRKGIYIGFAGRFVKEKGIDYLLSAIPLVVKKLPNCHFLFAGQEMSYESFWQENKDSYERAKQLVTLTGLLDSSEMKSFYTFCSVVVIPSRSDCFPSVAVEAILSGCPVVVNNIPGARWIVQTTAMGTVTEAQDPQALASAIVDVVNNHKIYMKWSKRAWEIFDYTKTLDRYEKNFFI